MVRPGPQNPPETLQLVGGASTPVLLSAPGKAPVSEKERVHVVSLPRAVLTCFLIIYPAPWTGFMHFAVGILCMAVKTRANARVTT